METSFEKTNNTILGFAVAVRNLRDSF